MKRITINDIAKKAGVTKGTVSMVLNNNALIPQPTKDRILKIMKDLDYYPRESAQILAKGRTEALAFISTRFAAPFISNILDSFEQRAFFAGKYVHGIVPYSTRNEWDVQETILKRILRDRKADAVVMLNLEPADETVQAYKRAGIPIILIEHKMRGTHSITIDNVKGARLAALHFAEKGYRNIGMITGETVQPPSKVKNHVIVDRNRGFKAALGEKGLKLKEENIEIIHAYNYEEGRRCMDNFVRKGAKIEALFCAAGDIVAMGVIERARELKLKIPGNLAIIGYDDTLSARHLNPPLTTVRQPLDKIGEMAFDLAVEAAEGRLEKDTNVKIEPSLIIRKST